MTTGGRSVHAIDRLRDELLAATDALIGLLTLVGIVFAAIFALSLLPPQFLRRLPLLTTEILPRMGQAVVAGGSTLIVLRARLVPAILRRCLSIRHEIAADEARKKTIENASKIGSPQKYFARDPDFGQTVSIEDPRLKEPH